MSPVSRSVSRPVSRSILAGQSNTLASIIKSLFANNEQGFVYDPNDLSTMFQDSAGAIPVTGAGQPVGLMLDKSRSLRVGNEWWDDSRVTFAGESVRLGENRYSIKSIAGEYSGFYVSTPVDLRSVFVVVEFTIEAHSVGQVGTELLGHTGSLKLGKNRIIGKSGTSNMQFKRIGVTDVIISNISVKELFGNHAYQTTSSKRPLLVASPQRLDYDTVDDKLITNLPAQLTGCTVVRAVPNVGTQILADQTIPATYEDNKDHCGLIVINRNLTATETSQITKLFNKAAGV